MVFSDWCAGGRMCNQESSLVVPAVLPQCCRGKRSFNVQGLDWVLWTSCKKNFEEVEATWRILGCTLALTLTPKRQLLESDPSSSLTSTYRRMEWELRSKERVFTGISALLAETLRRKKRGDGNVNQCVSSAFVKLGRSGSCQVVIVPNVMLSQKRPLDLTSLLAALHP